MLSMFILVFMSFISFMFTMVGSPMGLVGLLILMSFFMVSLMSVLVSSWYAYMLFLVYVGGLLVMFIYICMISSNYTMELSMNIFYLTVVVLLLSGNYMLINTSKVMLGGYSNLAAYDFPLELLISLAVLLLATFLAMVQTIFCGGTSLKIEVK
nr:NADH dehydrogenase subunit 6 [Punctum randolphii]